MFQLTEFSRIKWEHARALKKRRALSEAEQELKEALEGQPDHPLLRASLADLYQRQGKLPEARVLTEAVLSQHPEYTRALFVLGRIFFSEGKMEEALQCFQKASLRDQSPYLIHHKAKALRELNRLQEALETIESAPPGAKEDLYLLREKAVILARMNRNDQALRLYEKLHRLMPEDTFARKELYRLRGAERPAEEVIRELQMTLKLHSRSNDAQLHGLLGQRLKEAGRLKEAAEAFREAWRLSDQNLFFLKQEGFCHYRAGDYSKALHALNHAFRKDPGDVKIKSTLDKIYRTTGNPMDYVALLESILEEQPHHVKLWGTLKKLKNEVAGAEE